MPPQLNEPPSVTANHPRTPNT